MAGPYLEPIHSFGFGGPRSPGKPCQLVCISESTCVYPVSRVLAFFSEERTPPLRFTPGSANVEAIIALVASPSSKLVAACEKVRGAGQVTIYDARSRQKVKSLVTSFVGDFTACAFSPDGESLLTVANDEACTLTCWSVQKSKVLCTASVGNDVTRISFNKQDPTELATTGPRVFKLWRWNDKGLKVLSVAGLSAAPRSLASTGHRMSSASSTPKSSTVQKTPAPQKGTPDFTDHAWLADGTLAVANREGVVFLIGEGQVQQKLNHNGPVYCLAATAGGFLAGSVLGRVLRYRPPANKQVSNEWTKQEMAAGSGKAPVVCIALDPSEANAKVVIEGESVLSLSLTAMDADLDSNKSYFTPMLTGLHSGEVLGIDICARRALLASISTDMSIRMWDYQRYTSDLVHILEEEPRAIACNPWGYQLMVALPQRVVVFAILVNRLQVGCELNLKDCTRLKYSPSGHLAAAATPRELTIFNAITWTPLAALRGHSRPVSSLCWSSDSLYLVSSDGHGNIYCWSMERLARVEESVIKGSDYTCILYNEDRTALIACGASTPLRVFDTGKSQTSAELQGASTRVQETLGRDSRPSSSATGSDKRSSSHSLELLRADSTPTADSVRALSRIIRTNITSEHFGGHSATVWMAGLFSRALLATGARNGALGLRTYPVSADGSGTSPELFLHGGSLTSMCCEERSGLVFSSSLDGSIFVCSVSKRDNQAQEETAEVQSSALLSVGDAPTSSYVLVDRTMLREDEKEKEELRWSLQKLSDEAAYKLHRVAQDNAVHLKEVEAARAHSEMALRQQIKELEKKHIEAEERYQTTLAQDRLLKEQAVQEATERGEAKLLREARRADALESELKALKQELEGRVAIKLAEHKAAAEKVLQEHRTYEGKLRAEIEKLHREAASKWRKAETELVEEFDINEEELHNVMTRARTDYEQQVQRTFEARGQAIFERNKATEAENRKIALEQEVKERHEQVRKLENENAVLKDKVAKLEVHRTETDQLLLDKEDEILHMRKTIGEHEAYAMIRDTKIKKLESKEEPLKEENAAQKQKLVEAEEREAAFASEFWTWQEAQRFLKVKVAGQEREMSKLRASLHAKDRYIELFTTDLCKVVRDQDASEWPRMIKALYAAYVDDNRSQAVAEAREGDEEILRQKQCLERFVKVLKDTIARIEEKSGQDIERIRGENVLLLSEMAESNRKMTKLKALLRQQQARVAHSRAVQRALTQKLKEVDPNCSTTSKAWNTFSDLEYVESPEQNALRIEPSALSGSHSELLQEDLPSPLPRLPRFNLPLPREKFASGTSTSFQAAERDGQNRPQRLTSAPGRPIEQPVARPGTATASIGTDLHALAERPQTSFVLSRPLEESFAEASLLSNKGVSDTKPKRLSHSSSFGRLAKGPALSVSSSSSMGQVKTSGTRSDKGQVDSFRRATSLKRVSQEESVAEFKVESAALAGNLNMSTRARVSSRNNT